MSVPEIPDKEDIEKMLEYPPSPENGDLAFPCFKFSKILRKSPAVIASEIAGVFPHSEFIEKTVTVGGYLNFYLSHNAFLGFTLKDVLSKNSDYGRSTEGNGKTVVLDYSSPNVAKPFHIGHLGTTVIGHSIRKMHEFSGYKCVGVNHLGDWGTQFGKLIVAYRKYGDEQTVIQNGIDELVRLYVLFHAEAEKDHSLDDLAREIEHPEQDGKPGILAIIRVRDEKLSDQRHRPEHPLSPVGLAQEDYPLACLPYLLLYRRTAGSHHP